MKKLTATLLGICLASVAFGVPMASASSAHDYKEVCTADVTWQFNQAVTPDYADVVYTDITCDYRNTWLGAEDLELVTTNDPTVGGSWQTRVHFSDVLGGRVLGTSGFAGTAIDSSNKYTGGVTVLGDDFTASLGTAQNGADGSINIVD